MTLNPWFAYECMCTAFNERRYRAALALADAILRWLETPDSLFKFKTKQVVTTREVRKWSSRRLEDTNNPEVDSP